MAKNKDEKEIKGEKEIGKDDNNKTEIKKDIKCMCGNDTFKLKEYISGSFHSLYVECSKCGNAVSHGAGLTVGDTIYIMQNMQNIYTDDYIKNG